MQHTPISWAHITWNPVTGCSHAGPECWHCYAEDFALQQAKQENSPDQYTGMEWTVENAAFNVQMHPDRLGDPFGFNFTEPGRRIFVGSMTDVFHPRASEFFIRRILGVVRHFPEHHWLFLTKRPGRAAALDLDWPANAWLGTSVGSGPDGIYPDTTHRLEELRQADAETLWVSFEPLIEPVGDVDLTAFDWVVVGGETGEERREMEIEWARDLLKQARRDDAAFYFKQHSARTQGENTRLSVEENGWFVERSFEEFPETAKKPEVTA